MILTSNLNCPLCRLIHEIHHQGTKVIISICALFKAIKATTAVILNYTSQKFLVDCCLHWLVSLGF